MTALILAIALQQAAAPAPPAFDAAQASVSPARVVAEVDSGTLKGDPIGLAWSSDGSLLYLRAAESDRFGNQRSFHFTVPVAGGKVTSVDAVPAWAASYWLWKSGTAAPGVPEMKLQTETQSQIATATGTVRDDGVSQSRADPTQSQIASDYGSSQKVATMTVKLKDKVVAQSVNRPVVPGMTWGWAPAPLGGLAFADAKKHLVLIDRSGRTVEVPGTADVMLPAWSPDGRQIAFLQKKGRKGFVVSVVEVSSR